MPKYGIHYIVLKESIENLQQEPAGSLARLRGEALAANPFFANLGAIGPDLFFYALDYKVMQIIEPFHTAYRDLQKLYDTVTGPKQALEQLLEDAALDTLDQLEQLPFVGTYVADIRTIVEQIMALDLLIEKSIEEVFKAGIVRILGLDAHDPNYGELPRSLYQELFQSGTQAGLEEPDWYWFDMLHYRRTGRFAANLLRNAGNNSALQAYALGYMSHIATDTVGHPYVNLICGAPYRIAVQRHVTAENYMDQWKWNRYFDGENIRARLYDAFGFEAYPTLPDPLAELLSRTLMQTYSEVSHPLRLKDTSLHPSQTVGMSEGFLSAEDIKRTYELLRSTLQLLGRNPDLRPVEPYEGADEDLADLNASLDIFDPPPAVGPPPIPNCDWENIWGDTAGECFTAFVEELQTWMNMVRELVDWARETGRKALNLIVDTLDNPQPGMPTRWLQLMLYMWQQQAYTVYRALNSILAQAGLVYPEPDEVALDIPLARSLITPSLCWQGKRDQRFPKMRPAGQSHLTCPRCEGEGCGNLAQYVKDFNADLCCELPTTTPAFYPRNNRTTPDIFIHDAPFDENAVIAYANANSPQATRALHSQQLQIGNAIDFTTWMMKNARNPATAVSQRAVFADWNLDGDRGYAYKCWDGLPPLCHVEGVELGYKFYGSEFAAFYPRVWPDATNRLLPAGGGVRYISNKRLEDCIETSLNLSEDAIPDVFTRVNSNLTIGDWRAIVPNRVQVTAVNMLENIRFVNGVRTNHYVAIQDMHHLRLTLRAAAAQAAPGTDIEAVLVHNRTGGALADFAEAIPDKLLAYRLFLHSQNPVANTFPAISNPTTISIIALLHQAMADNRPVMLVGYSQGTMITGNAVMCFNEISPAHATFLSNNVKLLHFAAVLFPGVRGHLKNILGNDNYLAYTNSNAGDPLTFVLAQPADSISPDDAAFFLNPRFSPEYWLEARNRIKTAGSGFLAGLQTITTNLTSCELFDPHMAQNYYEMLRDDVTNNATRDGVNVRDFLFS